MKINKENKIKKNHWVKEEITFWQCENLFVLAVALPQLYKQHEEMGN